MIVEKLIKYLTRTKFRIILMKKHFDSYFVEKVVVLSKIKREISINGKMYGLVNLKPVYFNRNERVFVFDELTGQQLMFDKEDNQILTPEVLDDIMHNGMVEQTLRASKANTKQKILDYIIGFLIGALLASLIVLTIMQKKIDALYEQLTFISEVLI